MPVNEYNQSCIQKRIAGPTRNIFASSVRHLKKANLSTAEIVCATRFEMAQTVEDVLARRTRALFLNAKAAIEIAPKAARIMAMESGETEDWIDIQIRKFNETAVNYIFGKAENSE